MHPAASLRDDLATALTLAPTPPPQPDTTRFLYDGDVLCAELRAPHHGGLRTHVHEPATFVPLLQCEAASIFTVVNDHLGMPKELIDAQGRVAWAAAHSAWARITDVHRDRGTGETVGSPFRLLGQYADHETGLCYVRFRYFDPDAGRWCSPDPIGFDAGENLHGWVGAPSTNQDPLGLAGEETPETKTIVLPSGETGTVTAPKLPPGRILRDGDVIIEHYYHGNDHGPAHAHVKGGGPKTRIGPLGRPLPGDPALSPRQRAVVNANLTLVRRMLNRIGRWL